MFDLLGTSAADVLICEKICLPEQGLSGGRQVRVPEVRWQVAEWSCVGHQVVHVGITQVQKAVVWNPAGTEHWRSCYHRDRMFGGGTDGKERWRIQLGGKNIEY